MNLWTVAVLFLFAAQSCKAQEGQDEQRMPVADPVGPTVSTATAAEGNVAFARCPWLMLITGGLWALPSNCGRISSCVGMSDLEAPPSP